MIKKETLLPWHVPVLVTTNIFAVEIIEGLYYSGHSFSIPQKSFFGFYDGYVSFNSETKTFLPFSCLQTQDL